MALLFQEQECSNANLDGPNLNCRSNGLDDRILMGSNLNVMAQFKVTWTTNSSAVLNSD